MRVSKDSYQIYSSDNKVIAVSTFAGKTVRGIAKCDPNDTFSFEKGKELAIARCNAKVAQKRMHRAQRKFAEAVNASIEAKRVYENMRRYLIDSENEYADAQKNVNDIISMLD